MTANRVSLALLIAGFALFPLFTMLIAQPFYVTLVTRIMILALAASSLNFILGYGGMVSFGHAAFFGVGGYVVGSMAQSGVNSAWISWPVAIMVTALLGLAIGAISLRTRGVYFIMITLAFAQMLFFLFTSLRTYGGQDGMSVPRSVIGFGLDPRNNTVFYYVVLVLLFASLYLMYRIIHSRFGHALQSIKHNESRMMAIGYPAYFYKLVGFVIGCAFAGLAGALNANLNTFISPNSLAWTFSGQILIIVILGGVGRFWGGVMGAFVFILVETVLERFTIHWQFGLGLILLLIVLVAPQGITGLIERARSISAKTAAT
jgi:branched-chain amino acid transport system permease protein